MTRPKSNPSFLRHAAVYGLGQVILYAAPIVLLPLYTRHLTKEDFGTLSVVQRIGDLLTLCLLLSGFRQASLAIYSQSNVERRSKVIGTVVALVVAIAMLGLVIAFAGAGMAGWSFEISPRLVFLAGAAALMESMSYVLLVLPQAREESKFVVGCNIAQLFLRVGLAILFVTGLEWGAEGALIASALAAGFLATIIVVREGIRFTLWPDAAILRELFVFALPFLPGGLCLFLLNNGDRFLVVAYSGKEAVGVYDLGYRLAMAVYSLSMAPLHMVWGARMYQVARQPGAAGAFGKMVSRILLTYMAAALGLCLFAEEAVTFLGAGRYPAAAAIVPPVALACLFLGAATLFDGPFYVTRRTGLKTLVSLASAVVVTGFYALLIPPFGGLGAAVATIIGFSFQAALTRLVGQRLFSVAYEDSRLVGSLAIAIGLWGTSRLLPAGIAFLPAKVMLWACFPIALWSASLIHSDEVAWIQSNVSEAWLRARALICWSTPNARLSDFSQDESVS